MCCVYPATLCVIFFMPLYLGIDVGYSRANDNLVLASSFHHAENTGNLFNHLCVRDTGILQMETKARDAVGN